MANIARKITPEAEAGTITDLLCGYASISLEKTNETAKMLSRIDNKYVVNFEQLVSVLACLFEKYAILEIKDRKQFAYSSCYYDDTNFSTYHAHHQGRRHRFKVRTREYVDSNLIFFETKFKGLRGETNKHRIACDTLIMPKIDSQYDDLIQEKYQYYFAKQFNLKLVPSLIVNYKRYTLVSLDGGERVTIDFNLEFSKPNSKQNPVRIGNDFIILETKSANGKGIADQCLKSHKIRQAAKCSKYCLGLNLIKAVTKNNRFAIAIKQVSGNLIAKSSYKKILS